MAYSRALDGLCATRLADEKLDLNTLALIPKIPMYRDKELLSKVAFFQAEWDNAGPIFLTAATRIVGKPFPMKELEAALYLCPRFPFMGTPLGFNVISYLNLPAKDIPGLAGKPLKPIYFVSTAVHEVLHKYINPILEKNPSATLKTLKTDLLSLYGSHLHLFALQRKILEEIGLTSMIPEIRALEGLHGADYKKAWDVVYADDPTIYLALLAELKK